MFENFFKETNSMYKPRNPSNSWFPPGHPRVQFEVVCLHGSTVADEGQLDFSKSSISPLLIEFHSLSKTEDQVVSPLTE